MKKIFYSFLILIMGLFLLAGCGKKADVIFWHTFGKENQKLLDQAIKDFNKKYPEITVSHSQKGGYKELKDAISNALPAGNEPSMSVSYTDHVASYNSQEDRVVNLEKYINSTEPGIGFTAEEKADFIESFYKEGSSFTKPGIYSLPFAKSVELMFYNQDFFEKHKLAVPKTWEDLKAVAEQIKGIFKTENTPNKRPIGYDAADNLFIVSAEQLKLPYTSIKDGQGSIDFADPKNNQGIKDMMVFFDEMYRNKLFLTKQELPSGAFTSTRFIEQELIISIGSTGGLKYVEPVRNGKKAFKVGVAPAPQFDLLNKKGIQQGPNINMFDKDEETNKKTWLFMKHLLSTEFSAEWASQTGYAPVRKSSYETDTYKKVLNNENSVNAFESLVARSAKVVKEVSEYTFVSPAFPRSSNAREAVKTVLHNLFIITKFDKIYDPKTALAEVKKLKKERLEEIQKILNSALQQIEY